MDKKEMRYKNKRVENTSERIERLHHLYDDGPKPKHYGDESIVDMEKWNSMSGLEKKTPVINKTSVAEQQMIKVARQPDSRGTFKKLVKEDEDDYQKSLKANRSIVDQVIDYSPNKIQRPKPFKNEDPSTYPMNQKKTLNTWEAMLEVAKNPKTPEDRKIANEYKRMIHKDYYNPKKRGLLSEEDLKFVGKHPTQLKKNYPEVKIPQVNINYKPFVATPGPSLNEVMGRAQRQPGLSKDLIEENAMIRKNIEYVLGEDQKEEVRKVELENNNNKENEDDR
tara:strand:+ start:267 stop:1106 length:840 start_codon:yes stop_codon:yes gene_type:complete